MSEVMQVDKLGIPLMQQLPQEAREFVEALLQKDPSKRPKITHLYDFPLFVNSLSPAKKKERSGAK
jgi:serine/threonine protein kinase